jgi:ADP-dependent NAD(P)H-hydrate dehydratase / NAD(P)H-hydrate epimerase
MENAGRAAAQVIHHLFPRGPVLAVAGSGNNGGDALVALRSLRAWGRDVAWLVAGSRPPDHGLLTNFDVRAVDPVDAPAALAAAAVVVDGILGTGASGAPREPAAGLIRRMNGSGRPIVALDIPTGVDPTTGQIPGEAVDAAVTIQFGWPKTGALLYPGRQRCGRIIAVEIGFPPLLREEADALVLTPGWAVRRLPARPTATHKNAVGRVLVLAGREGVAGAAAIAGESALRAGAGYVRIATVGANRTIVQSLVPEALFVDRSDPEALREAVAASDAVVAGPGLGTDSEAEGILDRVLDALDGRGCVLDADALTLLARRSDGFRAAGGRAILTPHPGEMSRITGLAVGEVTRNPMARARALAAETGATVLLKGSPSVVAAPGERVLVAAGGTSDLATAGMGDQLGGMIAAFLAAGAAPAAAAGLALFYGGRAAELAGRGRSLTPRDVSRRLHHAFRDAGPRHPPSLPFIVFDQPASW